MYSLVYSGYWGQKSLPVADDPHQEAIDFYQPGIDLGTVSGAEFQVFAVVHQPGQEIIEIVDRLLVEGNQRRQVGQGNLGSAGSATRKNRG